MSRWDTYPSETHCKLRRSAAVGQASLHPLLVPQSGTDYHPQHHRGCVSPPSGNYMGGGVARTHSCAASQLAVGFIIIGPAPRNPQLLRFALSSCLKKHVCMSSCLKTCLHVFMSKKACLHVFLSKKHVLHVFLSKKPVFPSKHKKGFRNLMSRNPFLLCQCYAAMPLTFFRLIT